MKHFKIEIRTENPQEQKELKQEFCRTLLTLLKNQSYTNRDSKEMEDTNFFAILFIEKILEYES